MPDSYWPGSSAEQTDILPAVSVLTQEPPTIEPTPPKKRFNKRKAAIIGGSVFGGLVLLWGADLLISGGSVPRGVTVAGVDVGGMSRDSAEKELRAKIEPRLSSPVQVKAGDVTDQLAPKASGLTLDWPGTLDQAGSQPLNPFTRIASFFSSREVGVVTHADDAKLGQALEQLRAKTDRDPIEGTIRFDEAEPVLVEAKQGQKLDVPAATQAVLAHWAAGQALELPVALTPVQTNPDALKAAFEQIAKPAVAGPLTIKGEGKDAKLEPAQIAAALSFEPITLAPKIDQEKVVEAAGPQLKSTEKEGKEASIVFEGGKPTVEPSVDGRGVDWEVSLKPMVDVLKLADKRELKATYKDTPAKVTTEQANELGVKEVIGEFTTGGFAADSGTNIHVVANKVNGAIVKPGETFSLNGFTGPRGTKQGYVEAGVISDGAPGREVGGGISQFATTLYNAAYFAGMKDAGHKEHSYYISRYPAAREATVFQNHDGSSVIDLKFTNDSQTGVAIQTIWTPSSLTVKLWGTKRYKVESIPGDRSNLTEPQPKAGPAENCHASNGAQGFTTTDTRVLRDAATGREVSRSTRTVKYNPQPKITCGE
ncbi:VanW family protein [Amycolatopsis sp. NPDC059657]|uniref:VanW family protein n=1 Tax=Amycolatopsis sp. NPDC059657 TaxID=3346899 RepID=UPI00366CAAF4